MLMPSDSLPGPPSNPVTESLPRRNGPLNRPGNPAGMFHPAPAVHAHSASLLPPAIVAVALLIALVVGAVLAARR
jgi:hypothetical protein